MVVGSTDGGFPWGVIDRGGGSIVHGNSDDSDDSDVLEDSVEVGRGGGGLNWGLRFGGGGSKLGSCCRGSVSIPSISSTAVIPFR